MAKLKTQFNDLVEAPQQPQWQSVVWDVYGPNATIPQLNENSDVSIVFHDTDANAFITIYIPKIIDSFTTSPSVNFTYPYWSKSDNAVNILEFYFNKTTKTFFDFNETYGYINNAKIFYK